MIRPLMFAVVVLCCAAAAHAQELPPGRVFAAQAIGMCLDLHEERNAKLTAPPPFALNPQGYLLAEDRGVLVAVRAERGLDPDFDEMRGACTVQLQGDVPWFADFAATMVVDLKSLGWDIAQHQSGLVNGTQTIALVGYGSVKIQYGVERPNAQFVLQWTE